MVQVVVLTANGESRTLKTSAFTANTVTGAAVAKALRKTKAAEIIGVYTAAETKLTVWGWREGKAGAENKHELPPLPGGADEGLLFGDAIVTAANGNFTAEQWATFYETAFGGFEDLGAEDSDSDAEDEEEEEEEEEEEDYEEGEDGEEGEGEGEEEEEEEAEEEAEDDEEEAEEEDDADDDCYDDGDDAGGGSKRRAPRRRAATAPEYRRIDMGLRSRVKLPAPPGKRAPRWQTAPELVADEYD